MKIACNNPQCQGAHMLEKGKSPLGKVFACPLCGDQNFLNTDDLIAMGDAQGSTDAKQLAADELPTPQPTEAEQQEVASKTFQKGLTQEQIDFELSGDGENWNKAIAFIAEKLGLTVTDIESRLDGDGWTPRAEPVCAHASHSVIDGEKYCDDCGVGMVLSMEEGPEASIEHAMTINPLLVEPERVSADADIMPIEIQCDEPHELVVLETPLDNPFVESFQAKPRFERETVTGPVFIAPVHPGSGTSIEVDADGTPVPLDPDKPVLTDPEPVTDTVTPEPPVDEGIQRYHDDMIVMSEEHAEPISEEQWDAAKAIVGEKEPVVSQPTAADLQKRLDEALAIISADKAEKETAAAIKQDKKRVRGTRAIASAAAGKARKAAKKPATPHQEKVKRAAKARARRLAKLAATEVTE